MCLTKGWYHKKMVREPGLEPGQHAWQARIIPLDHSRTFDKLRSLIFY